MLLEENLWCTEFLEEDVGGLDTIAVRIERRLSQKDRVFLWRNFELIEDMSPKLLHIIPILNDTVLNWIIEFEDSPVFVLNHTKFY